MQKQTNFFEENVQWFALGLGGLFLAWMLYAYVLSTPVAVDVGTHKSVPPGEVDKFTLDEPIANLKRDIARSEVPEIPQVNYVKGFMAAIHGSKDQPIQLAKYQIRSTPMVPEADMQLVGGENAPKPGEKPVTMLPAPPGAKVGSHTEGRSQVSFGDPKWVPNPNKPNDQQPFITADKDWWSGEFIINGDELYQAFAKAFDVKRIEAVYPTAEPFFQTALVDVQLIRQEILPGNKPGPEVVVKHLENQPDTIRPPYPADNADPAAFGNYLNIVTQNPGELQSPPFYDVIAGDPWMEPGEETDAKLVALAQANKEQRKLMKDQQRQAMLQKQAALQAARNPRGGMAAGEMLPEEMGDMDQPVRGARRPFVPPAPILPGVRRPGVLPGRPGAKANVAVTPVVLGAGKFKVEQGMGPIRIIAHDDTVESGKTYRYKLRYRLFNPVYRGNAAAPELTKVFALKATDSPWTKMFTTRPKVEFFLAAAGRDRASFDTFQFKDGQVRKSTLTNLGAGDAIGPTGWSLVDAGGTGDKAYALLMDDNGQVVRREPNTDKESDRYDELNFEATTPQVGANQ
jgi:hypothetical protein